MNGLALKAKARPLYLSMVRKGRTTADGRKLDNSIPSVGSTLNTGR